MFLILSGIGGKLLVFQSTPPSVGVGHTKQRDNPAAYSTDREPLTRKPEDPFFKTYAAEASRWVSCLASSAPQLQRLWRRTHV